MARISLKDYSIEYAAQCTFSSNNVTMTEAVQKMEWGTYGDREIPGQLVWKRLVDLSSEHLNSILKTQPHLSKAVIKVIRYILKKRGVEVE